MLGTEQRAQNILFSVVFFPQPSQRCLGPTCHLTTLIKNNVSLVRAYDSAYIELTTCIEWDFLLTNKKNDFAYV
jgi:hypothetical protein